MSLLKRPTLFDLIIRDTQNQLFSDIDRNGLSNTSVYAPSVNTYRTGNDLTFEVAAPGYNKQGLNVSVDRNVLTIQGDANTEDREGATLTARYNDGILTVNASLLDSSKTLNINIE